MTSNLQPNQSYSKIAPCLWFNNEAEAAAKFYVSVFENSEIISINHYGESGASASEQPAGSVMTVVFKIAGQKYMALNGGPVYTISPAISFMVNCETQDEIDYYWNKLSEGGAPIQCGWLNDQFGVSWQIVPAELGQMMKNGTPAQVERVMAAILQMIKLDLNELKAAYEKE
jgi:predicted 3-demethylubiquinone-9 3-methyltransferase (glyoxalase superfamily)